MSALSWREIAFCRSNQSIDWLRALKLAGRDSFWVSFFCTLSWAFFLCWFLCVRLLSPSLFAAGHTSTQLVCVCVCVCSCTIVHSFVKCTLSAYHTHRTLIILSRPVLLPSDLHYLPTDCSLLSPSSTEHFFGFNWVAWWLWACCSHPFQTVFCGGSYYL